MSVRVAVSSLFLILTLRFVFVFFFFNDTATTEIYTLSLHDALPISSLIWRRTSQPSIAGIITSSTTRSGRSRWRHSSPRSEEHTSELQSRQYLVCRLLLEKKKKDPPSSASLFRTSRSNLSSDSTPFS